MICQQMVAGNLVIILYKRTKNIFKEFYAQIYRTGGKIATESMSGHFTLMVQLNIWHQHDSSMGKNHPIARKTGVPFLGGAFQVLSLSSLFSHLFLTG